MTSPIVQLPQVQLGNLATDVSSAGGNLIKGLMAQKDLQQKQALAAALSQAQVGRDVATTNWMNTQSEIMPQVREADAARATADAQQKTQLHQQAELMRGQLKTTGDPDALMIANYPDEKIAEGYNEYMRMKSAKAAASAGMPFKVDAEEDRMRGQYQTQATPIMKRLSDANTALGNYELVKGSNNPPAAEFMLLSQAKEAMSRVNQTEISRIARTGGPQNLVAYLNNRLNPNGPNVQYSPQYMDELMAVVKQAAQGDIENYGKIRKGFETTARGRGLNPYNVTGEDLSSTTTDRITGAEAAQGGQGVGGNRPPVQSVVQELMGKGMNANQIRQELINRGYKQGVDFQ